MLDPAAATRDLVRGWLAGLPLDHQPTSESARELEAMIAEALVSAATDERARAVAIAREIAEQQRDRARAYEAAGGHALHEPATEHSAQYIRAEGAAWVLDHLIARLLRA